MKPTHIHYSHCSHLEAGKMMKRVNTTNVPIQQHAYAIGQDVTNLSCVERKHMNVTPVRHENENLQSHRGGEARGA
jgi:hypothetical protein